MGKHGKREREGVLFSTLMLGTVFHNSSETVSDSVFIFIGKKLHESYPIPNVLKFPPSVPLLFHFPFPLSHHPLSHFPLLLKKKKQFQVSSCLLLVFLLLFPISFHPFPPLSCYFSIPSSSISYFFFSPSPSSSSSCLLSRVFT